MKIHIKTRGGEELDVRAKAVNLLGFDGFGLHRELEWDFMGDCALKATGDRFVVTYAASGFRVGDGETKQAAIENAIQYIRDSAHKRGKGPEQLLKATLEWWKKDPEAMTRKAMGGGPR